MAPTTPEDEAGVATAEGGMVLLDGPDGVAVAFTAAAAEETGRRLMAAAKEAATQERIDAPSN